MGYYVSKRVRRVDRLRYENNHVINVYDPNPINPNPNLLNFVSCRVVSKIASPSCEGKIKILKLVKNLVRVWAVKSKFVDYE